MEQGYVDTGEFGHYTILSKGDERIIYDVVEDHVFAKWNIKELMQPTQEGDLESSLEDGFNIF